MPTLHFEFKESPKVGTNLKQISDVVPLKNALNNFVTSFRKYPIYTLLFPNALEGPRNAFHH